MVIGVIFIISPTGLGLTDRYLILEVVGENQLLPGAMAVVMMSIILGMGVPGVAAYGNRGGSGDSDF